MRRIDLKRYHERLKEIDPITNQGVVQKAVGLLIESVGPYVPVGTICQVLSKTPSDEPTMVEVVGFREQAVLSMALGNLSNIQMGDRLIAKKKSGTVPVSKGLLGRVLDGMGTPLDGLPLPTPEAFYPLYNKGQNPLERENVREVLETGVKAIDLFNTCGKGQRVGIFGGSGVGKSTLMGMLARFTSADVNVLALVGERGREVRLFLEDELGEAGLKKSVVIVATSDTSPLIRIRATMMATAITEYFRDQGHNVLFIMDSVTRVAMAQREVGLAVGEPPSSRGYTPSVFAMLPVIVERAGAFKGKGSITAFYTVLVEGDDMNDPIADTMRSLLDGHVVLSRDLAWKNHYPAIALLESISRVMSQIVARDHLRSAGRFRDLLAAYSEAEDLINIGAYKSGNNPRIDEAIKKYDDMNRLLKQDSNSRASMEETVPILQALFRE